MADYTPSIVEYFSKQQRSCGYCSSTDGSHSYGLNAHTLRVEDYQNMIDRGWRRCGKYCYKPILDISCCPLYSIRCAAKDFKLSRTQKKILKRFNNFLVDGTVTKNKIHKTTEILQPMDTHCLNKEKTGADNAESMLLGVDSYINAKIKSVEPTHLKEHTQGVINKPVKTLPIPAPTEKIKENTSKNKSKKAKQLRIERKRQKLRNLGLNEDEINKKLVEKKKYPVVKTIADFVNEPLSKNKIHNLKIETVLVNSPDFKKSFKESALLFAKYQKAIHHESDEDCGIDKFVNFLIESPLEAEEGFGSYHLQYWVDDKLIAVEVIDILPRCVSSVYCFYDPDYAYLSLGTYGALREIEFTRKLSLQYQDLKYYYMGFYIHSCVKMKYKGSFKPSYLLCPETYTWHPIQECLPKIEASKYSRFNEDPNARDANSEVLASKILILYNRTAMLLDYFLSKRKISRKEYEEIMEYAKLMGQKCTKNVLLLRI